MKLRRWYASYEGAEVKSPLRKYRAASGRKSTHAITAQNTAWMINSRDRVKGAQNDMECDPGQRKPAGPVVAPEQKDSAHNRQ